MLNLTPRYEFGVDACQQQQAVKDVTCAQCGTTFEPRPRGHGARFCQATCRARWHVERRERLLAALGEALDRAAGLVRELRDGEKTTGGR